jgi:hypothetical protein
MELENRASHEGGCTGKKSMLGYVGDTSLFFGPYL